MSAIPLGIKLWQEALIENITAGVDMLLICKLPKTQVQYRVFTRREHYVSHGLE